MKISKLILILNLLIAVNFIYGQRPNTKKIAVPYLQSPINPLNKNIETYFSKVVNYSTVFQTPTEIFQLRAKNVPIKFNFIKNQSFQSFLLELLFEK